MHNRHMWKIDMLLHLRTFVAVAEANSFSRAADELMIGQPLLSRRIQSLEAVIGARLFDRTRRQVEITDLGKVLLQPARDLLVRAERLDAMMRVTQRREEFRLGLPLDCDPRAVAQIVAKGAELGTTVHVREASSEQRQEDLMQGAVACALIRVPADVPGFKVALGLSTAEPLMLHPHDPIHLDQLRKRRGESGAARCICISREDDVAVFLSQFDRATTRAGLIRSQTAFVDSSSSALVRILSSQDAYVSSRQFASRNGLHWTPLADRSMHRTYRLAVSEAQEGNAEVESLVEQLAPFIGAALDAGPTPRQQPLSTQTGPLTLVDAWE
jgi:DNA-binding transcriptional LysR family regulator